MTFRKNHKLGFTTNREKPLTSSPVCIRLDEELAEKLKAVPDWQDKLRTVLPELIESWTEGVNSISSPR
ncbi:hypothetical protein G7B40_031755 [Aetokthonos hydrillicola Thurmond2011]|jgi:uncharacterized protein (DUF4415 family)|uniref:Uncharacterized protein n=1 Tax=Aetokthonos hydrillicola Thurmond2011 TaxID=2712845 RepID=A0AAP5MD40_9CYAN|nr:hypothetical protein [Aetokthonos hydrillicola]MBO3463582.1 hypothetical protein [Aetokthonos hydrillicola CCALA 1050]MBW4585390.1 hypothetical protein [Aetokthonos hydrillicola CCALA 1050]MDR9899103.1 hypothetical protein [Aetokthonos hydrillicola Thurmond2011]